ncbi:MAG: DUF692 family protein [Candidatus Obscuribacterales bacterium]|nr:DUF692 family protein [Candidatus Obscuribacterales bacterium]
MNAHNFQKTKDSLPVYKPGFGLRSEIASGISANRSQIGFLEVTPENYLPDVRSIEWLERFVQDGPLISHSVSLSLGSVDELDLKFLHELKWFANHFNVAWFSDHLSFSSVDGQYTYDLFPMPFSLKSARFVADRVLRAQEIVGRPLIIENIPYYIDSPPGDITESQFITAVAEFADCGLLLDLNNHVVNSINHNFDAAEMLHHLPLERVVQIHMAGHSRHDRRAIDTHGAAIDDESFDLLRLVCERTSVNAIMVERDQNFPPFESLMDELAHIRKVQENTQSRYDSEFQPSEFAAPRERSHSVRLDVPDDETLTLLSHYQRFFYNNWDSRRVPNSIETVLSDLQAPADEFSGVDHRGIGVYAWLRNQTRLSTLASIFPCCWKLLPQDYYGTIEQYFSEFPARSRDILKMGDAFPHFISNLAADGQVAPFLPQLAEFELTRHRLRSVQKRAITTPADVDLNSFEFLTAHKPVVVPGLELRLYSYPINQIHAQLTTESACKLQIEEAHTQLALYPVAGRWEPQVLSLSPQALQLLARSMEKRSSYLQLIGAITGKGANAEEIAAVISLLRLLHQHGVFVSIEPIVSATQAKATEREIWFDFYAATTTSGAHDTLRTALDLWHARNFAECHCNGDYNVCTARLASPAMAIDIGAGAGKDTEYLLDHGWRVVALDANAGALKELSVALNEAKKARLHIEEVSMETAMLSDVNLINASLSLPFCPPAYFDDLWKKIVNALQPGGIFCGHFFGPYDDWAESLSVVSKSRLAQMLKPFEVHMMEEQRGPVMLANGGVKQGHIFSVVAIKN